MKEIIKKLSTKKLIIYSVILDIIIFLVGVLKLRATNCQQDFGCYFLFVNLLSIMGAMILLEVIVIIIFTLKHKK